MKVERWEKGNGNWQKIKKSTADVWHDTGKCRRRTKCFKTNYLNWETEKFYPDILYVLQLSDLYQVSLDELLKRDESMILHLEDSTNTVKSNRKILLAFLCNICLLFLFFIFIMPISNSYLLTLLAVALVISTTGYILVQIIRKI